MLWEVAGVERLAGNERLVAYAQIRASDTRGSFGGGNCRDDDRQEDVGDGQEASQAGEGRESLHLHVTQDYVIT